VDHGQASPAPCVSGVPEAAGAHDFQSYAGSDGATYQVFQSRNKLVRVDGLRVERLTPGKG
jgi:hypothetical protein